MDITEAYVPAQAVHNAFVHALSELDRVIWPRQGRTPGRDEVISFVEAIKYTCFRHSRRYPEPAKKKSPPESDPIPDSRAEFYARRAPRPPY